MASPTPSPGALPTYVQISESIARRITAGQWLDGERLPPERTMAAEFGVAVGTLRKALSRLQAQKLLRRVQGSGNYINITPQVGSIYSFFRLESLSGAGLPTAQILSVDRLPKPIDAPYFGANPAAFRFRRLRFLDHQPAALEEIWLDGSVADHIAQHRRRPRVFKKLVRYLRFTLCRSYQVRTDNDTTLWINWVRHDGPGAYSQH